MIKSYSLYEVVDISLKIITIAVVLVAIRATFFILFGV